MPSGKEEPREDFQTNVHEITVSLFDDYNMRWLLRIPTNSTLQEDHVSRLVFAFCYCLLTCFCGP